MSNKDPAGTTKPLKEAATDGTEIADEGTNVSDKVRRARITERLQDGRDFLEALTLTRDYFSSRTLGEQIRRRIAKIGDRQGLSGPLGLENFTRRTNVTLQSELITLKDGVLDAVEQAEAILKELD